MSLSDLTLKGMEQYGGIDIKKNAEKNTYMGFVYSVALHALLILIYVGWTWITSEDDSKVPHFRRKITSIAELAPPPSTSQDMAAPPPSAPTVDVARPTFGIPVPVPDIQAPNQTMPTNDIPMPPSDNTGPAGPGGPPGGEPGGAPPPPPPPQDKEPSEDEFIEVSEEPKPTENIQTKVQYPETAKRSGLEGKVTFSALIGLDGRVLNVKIDKADYEVFKQPVIDAVSKVRFTPARNGQTPVKVWYTQTISFKLNSR
ncbi:MAG: TonB family protein [Bacteroidota bacterium]|nr:TonB family protein [Bacteroidota bacterium]MDP4230161.1 TonB family protein [Bacteroidota bacterium]MDP4236275.1 TonB family protein [Bacteroidota bacterium]